MSDDLRKPRPSEAAKDFLTHTLDLLPNGIMFNSDGFEVRQSEEAVIDIRPGSSYRDLLPYLVLQERQLVAVALETDARDNGDTNLADLLRAVREASYMREQLLSEETDEDERTAIIQAMEWFDKLVDANSILPRFFEILEKIANGEPLPPQYKTVLSEGYRRIKDEVLDDLAGLAACSSMSLGEKLDEVARKRPDMEITIRELKNDSWAEEEMAQTFSAGLGGIKKILSQIQQMTVEAKKMLSVIAPDIQIS